MFDINDNLDDGTQRFLQGWMDKYVAWVRKNTV